jgi:hypothetical protein
VIHGDSFSHQDVFVHQALKSMAAFASAQERPVEGERNGVCVSWQAPPLGWYKINWDVALCQQWGTTGIGAVICDCEGRVIVVHCSVMHSCLDPLSVKVWVGT